MSVSDRTPRPAEPNDADREFPSPTLNALISYALAEVIWAEESIHASMAEQLRKHHEQHAFMHLTIARRLEELKELLG